MSLKQVHRQKRKIKDKNSRNLTPKKKKYLRIIIIKIIITK